MLIFFGSVLNKDLMKPSKLPFCPAACGSWNVNLTQLNCWIKMNSVALYQWNQRQCCTSIKTSSCWPQAVSLRWEFRIHLWVDSVQNYQFTLCWLYLLSIELSASWFSSSNFDVPVAHCCPRSLPTTAVEDPRKTVQITPVSYGDSGGCGKKEGPDACTSAVMFWNTLQFNVFPKYVMKRIPTQN